MSNEGKSKLNWKRGGPSPTTEQFIERSKFVHGNDTFEYNRCIYHKATQKVIITCKTHGDFLINPSSHLSKPSGCQRCAYIKRNAIKSTTHEEWLAKALQKHGSKFDYSRAKYIHHTQKMVVGCPNHGWIEVDPFRHIKFEHGCEKCGQEVTADKLRFTKEEFIERARSVHGDEFDYSLVEYESVRKKVRIICQSHGIFEQKAKSHMEGSKCPKCVKRISKVSLEWMGSLGIDLLYEHHHPEINRYSDGYDPQTQTVYLFHGDYWHGNPSIFDQAQINGHKKKTYGELFQETKNTEEQFINNGYKVVVMWEKDWRDRGRL